MQTNERLNIVVAVVTLALILLWLWPAGQGTEIWLAGLTAGLVVLGLWWAGEYERPEFASSLSPFLAALVLAVAAGFLPRLSLGVIFFGLAAVLLGTVLWAGLRLRLSQSGVDVFAGLVLELVAYLLFLLLAGGLRFASLRLGLVEGIVFVIGSGLAIQVIYIYTGDWSRTGLGVLAAVAVGQLAGVFWLLPLSEVRFAAWLTAGFYGLLHWMLARMTETTRAEMLWRVLSVPAALILGSLWLG